MSIWSTEKSELNHQTISNTHILCPLTSQLSKGRMPSWYCRCHQLPSAGFLASCQLRGGLQPPHPVLQQDPGRSNSFEHQPVVWQRLGLATFWVVYGIITYYYGTEMKPFGKKKEHRSQLVVRPECRTCQAQTHKMLHVLVASLVRSKHELLRLVLRLREPWTMNLNRCQPICGSFFNYMTVHLSRDLYGLLVYTCVFCSSADTLTASYSI